jgi:hypothetical protein
MERKLMLSSHYLGRIIFLILASWNYSLMEEVLLTTRTKTDTQRCMRPLDTIGTLFASLKAVQVIRSGTVIDARRFSTVYAFCLIGKQIHSWEISVAVLARDQAALRLI